MAGFAGSSDVEGCTVIHARSDERQTHRDVNSLVYAQILDRNQPLIMILSDHDIELTFPGVHKYGVAGPRPTDLNAFRLRLLNCRFDNRLIFGAKETVLAGVRV